MSKKTDISNDLLRGRSMKKPVFVDDEEAAKVVEKVAVTPPAPKQEPVKAPVKEPEPEKEELVRTTMDLPRDLHMAIKIKSAQERLSLKDYVVKLVKKDLNLE